MVLGICKKRFLSEHALLNLLSDIFNIGNASIGGLRYSVTCQMSPGLKVIPHFCIPNAEVKKHIINDFCHIESQCDHLYQKAHPWDGITCVL